MNLKVERLDRGLSVNDASRAMGVRPHVLRQAERGTQPRPENAKAIADFFGVRVRDIWPVPDPDSEAAAA